MKKIEKEGGLAKLIRLGRALSNAAKKVAETKNLVELSQAVEELKSAQEAYDKEVKA